MVEAVRIFISDFFAASIEIFNRCYEQKELRRDIMAFFISYFLVVVEIWRAGFRGVKIILLIMKIVTIIIALWGS